MSENEINKVHVLIRRFLYETDEILHDAKACQQWLISFCKTLQFQDLCKNPNDYALLLLKEAKEFNRQQQLKAQKKQVRKVLKEQGVANPTKEEINAKWLELFGNEENPQDAPNGNAGVDRKSATSCDQFTADGDTREDPMNISNGRNAGSLESGTSANLYATRQAKNGDASHREAEDESATVSNPFALDMPGQDKGEQSAKTRDIRGSGRYQPPSLGPEDGNLFTTKEPSTISANGRRTGGYVREAVDPLPPVRQSEPDVMSMAYSGEFGNVRLTQEQYAELGIKFGNQQKLNRAIDSLSCKLENDELKPAPRSHYAVLVKWANYRDDMDEKEELKASSAPHYETVSEHNARIVRESDKWIHEYCQQQNKNRKAANG